LGTWLAAPFKCGDLGSFLHYHVDHIPTALLVAPLSDTVEVPASGQR
jgi:hypothetical protein